jgi:hypothetical protein
MKIAICISGFLRTWEYSKLSFLKHLVQNHDCDLFVHTYKQNYFEYSSEVQNVIYDEEIIVKMFDGFNLKKIVIEDRNEIIDNIISSSLKYEQLSNYSYKIKESSDINSNKISLGARIYDQLRKIYLSNELRKEYERKNNLNYDLYVKTRFDVLYIDKIDWSNFTEKNLVYIGNSGTGGFPDDLVGIGKEEPMNSYMDRFLNLDKMCFSTVNREDINPINWYPHHGNTIFPSDICAHDTLIRNLIHDGFDIKNGNFRNVLIRNKNHVLNWNHMNINGIQVAPSIITNGCILGGNNSYFDVEQFNQSL